VPDAETVGAAVATAAAPVMVAVAASAAPPIQKASRDRRPGVEAGAPPPFRSSNMA
jgi:hypothetical protein